MRAQPHLLPAGASLLSAAALLLALGGPAAAQLANGPWSMYRHDLCHTGQSPSRGPVFGSAGPQDDAAHSLDVKVWKGFDKLRTSPSLSKDGKTIYFGMGWSFCSVDAETMATNHCIPLGADASDSSPAVAADGTIYIGDRDNSMNAYTSNLTLKWRYNQDIQGNDDRGHEGDIWQHPVIAPAGRPEAGTIYFTHDQINQQPGIFTALIDNGTRPTVKWKYKIGNFVKQSSPAIDENGIIYFGDLNGYVYAFKDKGACPADNVFCNNPDPLNPPTRGPVLLWKKQVGTIPGITASPVISADSNTLYIGTLAGVSVSNGVPRNLTALDISIPCSGPPCPLPPVRWTAPNTPNGLIGKVDQTPALARDGTLYVPTFNMGQGRLYAIKPDGSTKWVFPKSTDNPPYVSVSETSGHPIVGGDGTVYVGLGKNIYALNQGNGDKLWTYPTTNYIQSSPLIGPVDTGGKAHLYVPSRDHNLYDIRGTGSTTLTPTTCWTSGATGSPPVNQEPIANAGADQEVPVGQAVSFDGADSFDPDGDPLTVTWNFGDGSSRPPCQASASDPGCLNPSHTYTTAKPAGYTATLSLSDGKGGIDFDTVKIVVTASGGGGTGSFQDNFNRTTGLGDQWAVSPANSLAIDQTTRPSNPYLANTLRAENIVGLLTDSSLSGAVQSASADFTSLNNNSGPRLGLAFRVQSASAYYRLYRWVGGTNEIRISKIFNGQETLLQKATVPQPAQGTAFHLVGSATPDPVTAGKTKLTLTLVGGPQITATDGTFAGGTMGVFINPGGLPGPHAVDNFCASIGGTCP